MCIRDRGNVELRKQIAKLAFNWGANIKADDIIVTSGCLEAVSYTHLRAHETVLDLVCRLLLEKKKQTNNRSDTTADTYTTN